MATSGETMPNQCRHPIPQLTLYPLQRWHSIPTPTIVYSASFNKLTRQRQFQQTKPPRPTTSTSKTTLKHGLLPKVHAIHLPPYQIGITIRITYPDFNRSPLLGQLGNVEIWIAEAEPRDRHTIPSLHLKLIIYPLLNTAKPDHKYS